MLNFRLPGCTRLAVFSLTLISAVWIGGCDSGEEHASDFNHTATFERAAARIVRERPFEGERRSLSVLYPGAGAHAAVLRMGPVLAEGLGLDSVEFILTDISRAAHERFAGYLDKGDSRLGVTPAGLRHRTRSFAQGSEEIHEFRSVAGGVDYRIVYALDRSDPERDVDPESGRILYYRQEYFDRADIVVHHDSSNSRQVSTFWTDFLVSTSRSKVTKQRVFLTEDLNQSRLLDDERRWVEYGILPGAHLPVRGAFGCREDLEGNSFDEDHLGSAQYRGAVLLLPEPGFWKGLSEREIKALVLLAVTNRFPDTGPVLREGQQHIFLKLAPELLESIMEAIDGLPERLRASDESRELLESYRRQRRRFEERYRS